jgi:hypothetical protein
MARIGGKSHTLAPGPHLRPSSRPPPLVLGPLPPSPRFVRHILPKKQTLVTPPASGHPLSLLLTLTLAPPSTLHTGSFKRRRASLRHVGVPNGRDVLAVYFWWTKQAGLKSDVASSIRSILGLDEQREREWEMRIDRPIKMRFERCAARFDLLGVGGQFN